MVKGVQYISFIVLLACTLLIGCTQASDSIAEPVTFNTTYGAVEFTFPAGWYQNPEKHPYDLQCFEENEQMNTGVFIFKAVDLSEEGTPYAIFKTQVADLESKRKNFKVLDEEESYKLDGKSFVTIAYTGEKGPSRYVYRFSLIEFDNDPSQFAVTLQVGFPGDWQESKPILDNIIQSARTLTPQ